MIAGVYLSAYNEHKQIVIDSFKEWFETVSSEKPIMICGDFNINMLSDSLYSKQFKSICDENGALLHTNRPTRIADNSTTMIDL